MRDNSAEDTSPVTGQEGDHELSGLGVRALVEAVPALGVHDLRPALASGSGECASVAGLHAHLQGLHGAEEDVGNDLSAGGGDKETDSLVLIGLGTEGSPVDILEHFVEAELSEALHAVADESGEPSESEALETLLSVDRPEAVRNTLVETRVSLHAALDDIKRADSSVGEAAGEDASNHALGVVASVVNVTHPRVVFRLFSSH